MKRGVMGPEGKCLIEDGRMTLASFLRDNSYAKALVDKWHLGMDFREPRVTAIGRNRQSTCRRQGV